MARLGLGWDGLHARNPRLVLCSITGYGQDGPFAQRAGHDLNYMAIAGGLGLNGDRHGPPPPLSEQVPDIGAGGRLRGVRVLPPLDPRPPGAQGACPTLAS